MSSSANLISTGQMLAKLLSYIAITFHLQSAPSAAPAPEPAVHRLRPWAKLHRPPHGWCLFGELVDERTEDHRQPRRGWHDARAHRSNCAGVQYRCGQQAVSARHGPPLTVVVGGPVGD